MCKYVCKYVCVCVCVIEASSHQTNLGCEKSVSLLITKDASNLPRQPHRRSSSTWQAAGLESETVFVGVRHEQRSEELDHPEQTAVSYCGERSAGDGDGR